MGVGKIPFIEIGWFCALLIPLYFVRVNKWLNPFIFYTWISSLTILQNPYTKLDYPMPVLLGADFKAAMFLVAVLILVTLLKTKIETPKIKTFLAWLGAFNITLTFLLCHTNGYHSGIVYNRGMNSLFNLSLLPFVIVEFMPVSIVFVIMCLTGVLFSCSRTPYIALFFVGMCFFRKQKALILLSILALLVAFLMTKEPFRYLDRLDGYIFFFKHLSVKEWLLGRGPGSFYPYSVYEQVREGFGIARDTTTGSLTHGNGLFLWMHSDVLQAVYEYGALGALTLIPILIWVFKTLKCEAIYSAIVLIAGSLFYYPFHWSWHLIVVFSLLKITHNEDIQLGRKIT